MISLDDLLIVEFHPLQENLSDTDDIIAKKMTVPMPSSQLLKRPSNSLCQKQNETVLTTRWLYQANILKYDFEYHKQKLHDEMHTFL